MSMTPLRLLVFGRIPPPMDGQSLATRQFIALMKSQGHQVNVIDANIPADASFTAKWRHYAAAGRSLDAKLDQGEYDVLVWQSPSPTPIGHLRDMMVVRKALGRIPTVAVAHWGTFSRLFTHPLTRATGASLIGKTQRSVFTQADRAAACAPHLPTGHTAVIHNSVESDVLPTPDMVSSALGRRRSSDNSDDSVEVAPFQLLFLSNMIKEKGYEDVLEGFRQVVVQHPDRSLACTFAGSWPSQAEEATFRARVADAGLDQHVRTLGPVADRSAVCDLHHEADLFLLPSYLGEAQPLSIIEALGHATPVVVADDGGMPDMIEGHACGAVVPPRSPHAISEAIIELMDAQQWSQAAQAARTCFEARFSTESIAQAWNELLHAVAKEGARR